MPSGKRRLLLAPLIVALIVAGDIITKEWVRSYAYGDVITTIGFIDLVHINNTGAAFGMFQGQALALCIIACITLIVILAAGVYIARRYRELLTVWNIIGFSCIVGGTIGNLVDRFRFGPVTDFIDPGFFPAFNVADSGITVGAIMLAIALFRQALSTKP